MKWGQICIILYTSKKVEDKNCMKNLHKFLCQIDPCKSTTSHKCPSSSAHSKPPDGYVYISQAGKYYRPYNGGDKGTFLEGLEKCQSGGGTFIEFRTDAEQNILKQMQSEYNDFV